MAIVIGFPVANGLVINDGQRKGSITNLFPAPPPGSPPLPYTFSDDHDSAFDAMASIAALSSVLHRNLTLDVGSNSEINKMTF
jgi:hypothetical protein